MEDPDLLYSQPPTAGDATALMFELLVVIMVVDFFNIGDWQTTISVPSHRAGGGKQLRMAKGRAEDHTSCRGDPWCIRNTIYFNCVPNHEFFAHQITCRSQKAMYSNRGKILRAFPISPATYDDGGGRFPPLQSEMGWGTLNIYNITSNVGLGFWL